MSFIYGANGSYIRDRRINKQTKANFTNETEKVNPKNLTAKFNQITCNVNKDHGNYDFVCIAPNCPYDRLICIDCFKDWPEKMSYMQRYGKFFLRMNAFIDVISKPDLNSKEFQKMEDIKKLQGKIARLNVNYDKMVESEMNNLKEFFRKAEDSLIDVVKKAMRRNYEITLEEFNGDSLKIKNKLDDVLRNCQTVTKFGNKGHLNDLNEAMQDVRTGGKETDLIEKINQIVEVYLNMENILGEWAKRIHILGNYPERILKPKINYMELGALYKQKEIIISEELENIDDIDLKDQYRYYSSRMDDLLEGGIGRDKSPGAIDNDNTGRNKRVRPGEVKDFFNLGGYSFVKPSPTRNERSIDFGKNLDISKINVNNENYLKNFRRKA